MNEAKEKYEKRMSLLMAANDRETAIKDSVYIDYIIELEQQNKQLKESQTQKQIIKLCERLKEAEQQNKQMIEALLQIYDFQKLFDIDDEIIELIKNIIEPVKTNQLTSY